MLLAALIGNVSSMAVLQHERQYIVDEEKCHAAGSMNW